ncbi:hypothetical protein [Arthrobacter sp. UYCo732]|uniref:hypothetical protein n=1 Tax=Arthrobacter sp. UYCo732 TaxID=3156336 RepID=UPI003391A22C
MTTITAARQPKGIPLGGQFAATTHAEPGAVLAAPRRIHEQAHLDLMGDRLTPEEESSTARAAIHEAMAGGDFGEDGIAVRDLASDDRFVRLAVDRYVVTESQEPGTLRPEDAGYRLGRILLDLQNEDIEDAVYGLERDEL